MNKHLDIKMDKYCNLDCSFCIMQNDMKNPKIKLNANLHEILENYLSENYKQFGSFSISGGEPLRDIENFEKILSIVLTYAENKKSVTINTNACYLTEDIVSILNEYENITVCVSIDTIYSSERNLMKLLSDEYKNGYSTLKAIHELKNKIVRSVIQRKQLKEFNLALELAILQKYFNCEINIALDQTTEELNAFNIDDVYEFQMMLARLEYISDYRNFTFHSIFKTKCNGTNTILMNFDGSISYECEYGEHSGCSDLRHKMKPAMYELLYQITNAPHYIQFEDNFKPNASCYIEPNYNIGYIGDRYKHTPKFKQSKQYEFLNQIPIKEIK